MAIATTRLSSTAQTLNQRGVDVVRAVERAASDIPLTLGEQQPSTMSSGLFTLVETLVMIVATTEFGARINNRESPTSQTMSSPPKKTKKCFPSLDRIARGIRKLTQKRFGSRR